MQRLCQPALALLALLGVVATLLAPAPAPAAGAESIDGLSLARHTQILNDPSGQLGITEVMAAAADKAMQPAPSPAGYAAMIGYSDTPYWLRIELPPAITAHQGEWLLEVGYYYRNDIQVFIDGERRWHTGNLQPLDTRPVFDSHYVFPIASAPQDNAIYLRLESAQTLNMRLLAWTPRGFEQRVRDRDMLHFGYAGAMLVLIAFNLFFGLALRDSNFLLYGLFTLSVAAAVLSGTGYLRLFVWPGAILWDQIAEQFFYSAVSLVGLLLARRFLPMPPRHRWLDRLFYGGMVIATVIIAVTLYGGLIEGRLINLYLIGIPLLWIAASLVIARGIIAYRDGRRDARFLIAAWCVLWSGMSLATAWGLGFVPSNTLTVNALQAGSMLEALLLSMALGERVLGQRRQQAYTAAALNAAELARQRRARLTTLVSHEFRNPLGVIRNQLALLQRPSQALTGDVKRRIGSIDAAIERLNGLVDQWFRSQRVLVGRLDVQGEHLTLGDWMAEQADYLERCFPERRLTTRIQANPPVFGEADLLATALFNLVDNACKYTPADGAIELCCYLENGVACLSVCDEGSGIAAAQRRSILEDFERGSAPPTRPGLGLGLSLVRDVMEKHNGQVMIEDGPRGGACFILALPVTEGASA